MSASCPKEIEHGHCIDCLKLKIKVCDICGNKEDVRLCGEYLDLYNESKCLCRSCRSEVAIDLSRSRSW